MNYSNKRLILQRLESIFHRVVRLTKNKLLQTPMILENRFMHCTLSSSVTYNDVSC